MPEVDADVQVGCAGSRPAAAPARPTAEAAASRSSSTTGSTGARRRPEGMHDARVDVVQLAGRRAHRVEVPPITLLIRKRDERQQRSRRRVDAIVWNLV